MLLADIAIGNSDAAPPLPAPAPPVPDTTRARGRRRTLRRAAQAFRTDQHSGTPPASRRRDAETTRIRSREDGPIAPSRPADCQDPLEAEPTRTATALPSRRPARVASPATSRRSQ